MKFKIIIQTLLVSIFLCSCESIELDGLDNELSDPGQKGAFLPDPPPGIEGSEDWVYIPSDISGLGNDAFWVMKYEAKAWNDANTNNTIDSGEYATSFAANLLTHKPVSTPDGRPWVSINADNAAAECESLGAGFSVISNQEWMAIARDAEVQDENWTGGTYKSGCLFRGNSGETTCGYNGGTGDYGVTRHARSSFKLSTGDSIFDMSGNLEEWTDWDPLTAGFQSGPSCFGSPQQLPSVTCGSYADSDYNTADGLLTTTDGVGTLLTKGFGVILRGGHYSNSVNAGLYMFRLNASNVDANGQIGFRCVYRP
ncbi:MAG: SUMF1/EgtB/PvdO family nonheme iron enzyme [Bacteriovoracaceae bacterium]|nr:SUMF1/EgtB/PvdO family nonheme iron enzyme [Bacteriovoracaceae bacterium]